MEMGLYPKPGQALWTICGSGMAWGTERQEASGLCLWSPQYTFVAASELGPRRLDLMELYMGNSR